MPQSEAYFRFPGQRSSIAIKRVCGATLQAETYALQNAQKSGNRIRAALAELYGNGRKGTDWDLCARMKSRTSV